MTYQEYFFYLSCLALAISMYAIWDASNNEDPLGMPKKVSQLTFYTLLSSLAYLGYYWYTQWDLLLKLGCLK